MNTPFKRFKIVPVEDYDKFASYGHLILETVWIGSSVGVAYVPYLHVEEYHAQELQDKAQLGIAESVMHRVNSQLEHGTFRVKGNGEVYILDTLSMVRKFGITRYKTVMGGITFLFDGVEHLATLI